LRGYRPTSRREKERRIEQEGGKEMKKLVPRNKFLLDKTNEAGDDREGLVI